MKKRQLVKCQKQKRSNKGIIEGFKKINLEFAEYKAALKAVKIKIITAGK